MSNIKTPAVSTEVRFCGANPKHHEHTYLSTNGVQCYCTGGGFRLPDYTRDRYVTKK